MSHHIIRRIKVTGGFLDGMDIRFKAGLNCIIGGRGTGKTTLIEFIRYGLNAGLDQDDADQRIDKLLRGNLNNGMIEVEFETREGTVYTIKRAYREKPMMFDQNGDVADPKLLDTGLSVYAAIFSQNQIETIAGDPPSQRELLDRFLHRDIIGIQQQIRQKQTQLKQSASVLQLLDQQLQGEDLNLQELPVMKDRLEKLNKELASTDIEPEVQSASEAKQRRDSEMTTLQAIFPIMENARRRTDTLKSGMFTGLKDVLAEGLMDGPNGDLFVQLRDVYREKVKHFKEHINGALACLDEMDKAAAELEGKLKKQHMPQDAAYHEILAKKKDKQARVKERDALTKRVKELETKQKSRAQIEEQVRSAKEDRDKLLWEYSDLCEKRYGQRKEMAAKLTRQLGGNIQIMVRQQADTAVFAQTMLNLMFGSGRHYKDKMPKVAQTLPPRVLARLVEKNDVETLVEATGLSSEFANTLVAALRKNQDARYDLEALDVEDVVEVELKTGAEWKPIERLSTGQKCSAILPLLLLDSVAPLLIDQPEDNLDNSYVSMTVVPKLMEQQRRRQMIFVTHNPNIPVLGEAQHVVVLGSDGSQARMTASGSVDAVKKDILNLLEGGFEAFEQRRRKYQDGQQPKKR
ncbi:MAG: AAA family ATPase [Deltaproteobacteria bacterium]|nr:AAA family ATPase [Deltaproteobacteria bacterium]